MVKKNPTRRVTSVRRRAVTLIYASFAFVGLMGIVVLSVDWGRMELTKTELRNAAVAAARYAAAGLQNDLSGVSAASANAAAVAAQNTANGQPIAFDQTQDVVIGIWDTTARTFTPTTDLTQANAVHVFMHCSTARGNGVPLMFLTAFGGAHTQDISADSIAMVSYSGVAGAAGNGRFEYFIPATSNPWLSGEPAGTIASAKNAHNNPDYAGTAMTDSGTSKNLSSGSGFSSGGSTDAGSSLANYAQWGDYAAKKASPIQAGGITVNGGVPITFDGINGGATNSAGGATVNADGGAFTWNVPNSANFNSIYGGSPSLGSENGIANVYAPINSTIGIFVNDAVPDKSTAPTPLNFDTATQSGIAPTGMDFLTLSPKLRQPFVIGDGRTSNGEVQQFIPPTGATRLFIGTMDQYEWSNNVGGFYVTAHLKGRIVTVE